MSSSLQTRAESMLTGNKNQQKPNTMKALTQLLLRPNITVKKTLFIKQDTVKKVASPSPTSKKESSFDKKFRHVNYTKVDRPKSLILPQSKEYYPDRLKRKMPMKKIVLRPRHKYTVIATTNKRKRKIPHREVKSPPTLPPELTMQELVLAAEQQGMDDEDLMEILTCPSPVWWEDAADREEIYIRFHEDTDENTTKLHDKSTPINIENYEQFKSNNKGLNLESYDVRNKGALKNDINFFTKFVEKRSKLENVLGYIKFKKTINDEPQSDTQKVRKDSTSGISDASINEEELLNDLENIEIPVAEIDVDKKDENDLKDVKNDSNNTFLTSNEKFSVQTLRRTTRVRKAKKLYNIDEDFKPTKRTSKERINNSNIPTDLPPLTKNPFKTKSYESPKSVESTTSDNTIPSIIEFDSISDSNIKFLDEFEEDKCDSVKNEVVSPKNVSPSKSDVELVTVYRILPTDTEKVDVEAQIKCNLLSKHEEHLNITEVNADKIDKNAPKNKKEDSTAVQDASINEVEVDAKSQMKRPARVSSKKVNYCYKCFSIYVTETCQYCLKRNAKKDGKLS